MKKIVKFLVSIPSKIGLVLIRTYQIVLRPLFPSACRFYPTCSDYTYQAISKYGLFKGVFLGTKRISRCHAGNPGGVDELA